MSRTTAVADLMLCVALAAQTASATAGSQSIIASNAGDRGYSIRQEVSAAPGQYEWIRLSSESLGGAVRTDRVRLCQSVGASGDCAALPVEVTFPASCGTGCVGGTRGHGFALVATNGVAVSDWICLLPTAPKLVVIYDIANSAAGEIAELERDVRRHGLVRGGSTHSHCRKRRRAFVHDARRCSMNGFARVCSPWSWLKRRNSSSRSLPTNRTGARGRSRPNGSARATRWSRPRRGASRGARSDHGEASSRTSPGRGGGLLRWAAGRARRPKART